MKGNQYDPFFEFSTEGIYKVGFISSIDISVEEEKQLDDFLKNAFISECNHSIANHLGYSKNEVKELTLNKFWNNNPTQNREIISRFIKSGYQVMNLESVVINNGKKKYYSNNLTGVIEDGKLTEIWGTMRDITELKTTINVLLKINESYIEKAQQLQFFNQQIEKVFYKITHDLNSPLSNIEGLINILKLNGCYNSDDVKPLIDLMQTAVVKFKSTIKEVAKVPAVEEEKLISHSTVNLGKIWEKALIPYENLIENEEVKITSTFEIESIDANSAMLYSVFQGMLGYALKHKNGSPIDIFLKTYKDENYLILETKQELDSNNSKHFEEVQELNEDLAMDLFLVEKIVQSTGGKMELKTLPRESTTLRVFLKV